MGEDGMGGGFGETTAPGSNSKDKKVNMHECSSWIISDLSWLLCV